MKTARAHKSASELSNVDFLTGFNYFVIRVGKMANKVGARESVSGVRSAVFTHTRTTTCLSVSQYRLTSCLWLSASSPLVPTEDVHLLNTLRKVHVSQMLVFVFSVNITVPLHPSARLYNRKSSSLEGRGSGLPATPSHARHRSWPARLPVRQESRSPTGLRTAESRPAGSLLVRRPRGGRGRAIPQISAQREES